MTQTEISPRQRDDRQGPEQITETRTTAIVESTSVTIGCRGRARRVVTVRCPYCRGRHLHVWPLGWLEPGERRAHCGRGRYEVLA